MRMTIRSDAVRKGAAISRWLGDRRSIRPAPHNPCEDTLNVFDFDRLRQVEVDSGLGRPLLVFLASPARNGDEHDPAERRLPPQTLRHLVPVHPGKPDIEQHHLWFERARRVQGLQASMSGPGLVAAHSKQDR